MCICGWEKETSVVESLEGHEGKVTTYLIKPHSLSTYGGSECKSPFIPRFKRTDWKNEIFNTKVMFDLGRFQGGFLTLEKRK